MAYTLEQLATEIRQALKAQPGPEGRQKVCAIVQNVLKDSAFVTKHVGDDATRTRGPSTARRWARPR